MTTDLLKMKQFLTCRHQTEAFLASCLQLAQLDQLYRLGAFREPLREEVDRHDLRDMRQLGDMLLQEGMMQFTSQDVCLLNPIFGASSLVGGADADMLLDQCLIDIKTTKSLKFSREYLDQLVG